MCSSDLVGAPLQSARNDLRNPPTVDKWGFALSALNCPGDDWRMQHDESVTIIITYVKRAGIVSSAEVGGIFADLLPAAAAQRGDARRDGVRPNLLRLILNGRQYLCAVKTLRYTNRY